ncbi:MAG TPA: RlmE family RNA methyltransferase [Methanocorpusculum sp.]|jgi:23S rRNA (uridine2552-2'-O)-methyltransferase|nr:RlmE family RNA methyltransferase [Methanocorpusculum sp.]MBR5007775.1 RlmE family RNA methyltransferase [Methanocorpusculum sp.]MBR5142960.1 RlmE family RNA methyltransferase [Methanocorpusculum sp.]MBR5450739.1 RlmE family RNA methyltransferase [Methanocorpusculum sp.]HJJ65986.1 RlmE family RNA methyltransferase [Methanocorpusculum sp.]
MGSLWTRDATYRKSLKEGFRARSAYKLIDINDRFNVIRKTDNVVDLGCAPGSWLQVLKTLTEGQLCGVDLNPIAPLEGVISFIGDFTSPEIQEKVRAAMPVVNVVVCDAAPHLSGAKSYDQARIMALNEDALMFAASLLKQGGNLVMKSFQGADFNDLLDLVKERFYSVRVIRSKATRRGSTECYIVAKNFIGDARDDRIPVKKEKA